MEKDGLVLLNFSVTTRITSLDRTSLTPRAWPRRLQPARFQPAIDKAEVLAAVINLSVIEPDKRPSLSRVTYFCGGSASLILAQVDGSIGGVIHAEQQHLPIRLIYPANRAVQSMRDIHRVRAVIRAACGPAAAKACGLS